MKTAHRYVEIEVCCDCPHSNRQQMSGEWVLLCWPTRRLCERGYEGIPDWCPLPVVPDTVETRTEP